MKYLIEYQLEDEYPNHKVVTGKDEKSAIKRLEKLLVTELIGYHLEEDEAKETVETLSILEITKV